ncbi:TPA: tRNA pseudouridine(55) synthase TruB [Candidatus Saccharibacteria bacterium]|nr:tRNA pseudouridine(55) synthase TruB [Candidatus Saccharibacteria bacterium]HIO87745.1 tRNA pseudouridine(55) synthase TruB [Candidatus Saccharibacteria bacterium]
MNRILLIDKPAGWTSFDVVAKVRGVLKKQTGQKVKVGHSGTLDPFATGLLVLGVGSYTKKLTELTGLDKTYEAAAILGKTSTTGDPEGELTAVSNVQPSQQDILDVFDQFTGDIEQVPPAFSAKKVNGKRAYDLARAGKEVTLQPVEVTVHQLELVSYQYPELKFIVKVSKGTYIRTLAEDIGWALTTGAYLTQLRRTEVGEFIVDDAFDVSDFCEQLSADAA